MDGRSKPRTQKQIQSYRYNFSKRDSLAKKIEELDSRLTFVQRIVLSMCEKWSDWCLTYDLATEIIYIHNPTS